MSEKNIYQHLSRLLEYQQDTGVFVWRVSRGNGIDCGDSAGYLCPRGYQILRVDGGTYKAHRVAFLLMTGRWPKGVVDHINGDFGDNRWENLRDTTQSVNNRNAKRRRDNKSGIPGVILRPGGKWQVFIGSQEYLGQTDDFFEAACLRKSEENRRGYTGRTQ